MMVFATRTLLATAAFALVCAQPTFGMSVGGGMMMDFADLGYVRVRGPGVQHNTMSIEHLGFGAWGFFDATFAEISVGALGGPAEWYRQGDEEPTERGSFFALDFGVLGRYPIALPGGRVSIFPLAGLGYNLVLASTEEGERTDSPTRLSSLRLQFGAGGDVNISENAFFRASVLGTWHFPGRYFDDWAAQTRDPDLGIAARTEGSAGVTVKLGVGFRL